jgi:hypothetical protein
MATLAGGENPRLRKALAFSFRFLAGKIGTFAYSISPGNHHGHRRSEYP